MLQFKVNRLRIGYVYGYILHALSGDYEFTASRGVHNSNIPLSTTAAGSGADFSGSNHFDARDFLQFLYYQSSCFSQGSVF